MFYSQFILAKKGPLGTIWIAAHLERKLRKNQVADTDIGVSVDSILFPEVPIALRLSSHLLLGVVRIYSRKVNYLFDDCSEALLKIKQAFRSTAVDLPPEESTAPYHSITLPETFDLDDFELPDNDIFQGNYVDQHVSTREQITLQDTMDGVVYSTSQFGLDERFGDGDASQINLDLDEELLLDKVAAAGHGVSDADPQGSVKPMTPWEQDNISERINETLETTTVNYNANQLGRLVLNAESVEYAEAPSTPGLVQEPNLSSVEKALAGDDHLESEDHNSNELMATESKVNPPSKSDFHHGNSHATDSSLHKDSNNDTVERNGYHVRVADVEKAESLGPLDGSMRSENIQGDKSDETAASPSCSHITSDTQDPSRETCLGSTNVYVLEGYLVDDQASVKTKIQNNAEITDNVAKSGLPVVDAEVHACQELNDPKTLSHRVAHEEMPFDGMNVLKPCSSHLGGPTMSSPGHDNSAAPNEQSVEVQGEECHVTDMQSEKSQKSGPSVSGDIQADNRKSDEPLDSVISTDIHLKELNNSMSADLSAPEKLLSVPEGLLDKPHDLLVDSTPEKEVLAGCDGVDAGNKLISGKKRSYTESTVTVESLNSSESFGVDRSKKNSENIPDDDDLLSSILAGRKSSVLKMKPTPPAPEVASRKRARSAPQTGTLKRKVLVDDTMVLHGDLIRQQLTNTEDIRRIRKKAPCTSPEILMIRIQFLEDEIFGEPIFTGMSAELTSLHCETHDLSKIRVSETDESHGSSEVAEYVECSVRPNIIQEGEKERSKAEPAESPIQTESQQVGGNHLGSLATDAEGHTNSVTDVAELRTAPNEPLVRVTEMDIDRGNVEVAIEATCSVVHGIETSSQTDVALENCNLPAEDKTDVVDPSRLTPERKVDAQPIGEDASLANIINAKRVENTEVLDRNSDDIAAVEIDAKGGDGDWLEEGKVGSLAESGATAQTDCTAPTENVNPDEIASLETAECNNGASANDDNSKQWVTNEDGVLAADLGCDNHMLREEPVIDSKSSVELGADMENASLNDGKNQVDLQSATDVELTAFDHPTAEDRGEFGEVTAGNDTEFLNVDDDEVAEDYDDGDGCAEDTRLLENTGWSSRTRAVAKYLQTLFGRESANGRKVLALDHLLAGKTRKEASRMFFETLVLKTKDYVHVEQAKPLDNHISIKPRAKLMKSDF